jgi:hypothetical protein
MEKLERIVVINNEFEARRLEEILLDRQIPFIVKSYHDTAYDGLWQTKSAWGHIEAPEKYREEIMQLYSEMV